MPAAAPVPGPRPPDQLRHAVALAGPRGSASPSVSLFQPSAIHPHPSRVTAARPCVRVRLAIDIGLAPASDGLGSAAAPVGGVMGGVASSSAGTGHRPLAAAWERSPPRLRPTAAAWPARRPPPAPWHWPPMAPRPPAGWAADRRASAAAGMLLRCGRRLGREGRLPKLHPEAAEPTAWAAQARPAAATEVSLPPPVPRAPRPRRAA